MLLRGAAAVFFREEATVTGLFVVCLINMVLGGEVITEACICIGDVADLREETMLLSISIAIMFCRNNIAIQQLTWRL